jgi:hypothetical protein
MGKPADPSRQYASNEQRREIEKPPLLGKQLFGLGVVYATPQAITFLMGHGRKPAELLGFHQAGDWGDVSAADRKANDLAITDGSRVLSCYLVEGRKIFVITEAAGDDELRASTCLLFAEEY